MSQAMTKPTFWVGHGVQASTAAGPGRQPRSPEFGDDQRLPPLRVRLEIPEPRWPPDATAPACGMCVGTMGKGDQCVRAPD